ncbi:DUF1850 domain-containing protein [Nocardiopsis sp. FIRDI 009]|uniref:DUF1850 domain-containing protein n=1 Tax=Nocardiopsis sp. FIRDI 009 TaxID=714197 RepID=UPI000E252367|nr:DUF1850 domain-containing protein [Nocardiopsis sp. FIRDI 009]
MAARSEPTDRPSAGADRRRRPRTAALLLAAAAAVLLAPVWPALRLTDDGTPLGTVPLTEGGTFTIAYVHSIDGLPIEEDLVVRDGRIVAEATRFVQYGAGMGRVTGAGEAHADGEWWVVEDMGRDVGAELVLRPGSAAVDHRLRASDTEIRLSPCLTSHRVVIAPARVSTLRLLLGRVPRPEC